MGLRRGFAAITDGHLGPAVVKCGKKKAKDEAGRERERERERERHTHRDREREREREREQDEGSRKVI